MPPVLLEHAQELGDVIVLQAARQVASWSVGWPLPTGQKLQSR